MAQERHRRNRQKNDPAPHLSGDPSEKGDRNGGRKTTDGSVQGAVHGSVQGAVHGAVLGNAVLALADGSLYPGVGAGKPGLYSGELCFNTAMSGYQEVITDPSYTDQMIVFTFPHIGNTGVNGEDIEDAEPAARAIILSAAMTGASNVRASGDLDPWLAKHSIGAISDVDTRALTVKLRDGGAQGGAIHYDPVNGADTARARDAAAKCQDMRGLDLAGKVSCRQSYRWRAGLWRPFDPKYDKPGHDKPERGRVDYDGPDYNGPGHDKSGHHAGVTPDAAADKTPDKVDGDPHCVVIDFGVKRNILRSLVSSGHRVTVVPANSGVESILAHRPDGIVLSNGPGDPVATSRYAAAVIRDLIKAELPIFGICLGHQLLALALGARTVKMHHGHRGTNHPVKNMATGKVEITSQNHGFVVDRDTLPDGIVETHRSLFDGSIEGIEVENRDIFSVQHHPEASPGPRDAQYLFGRFHAASVRFRQSR